MIVSVFNKKSVVVDRVQFVSFLFFILFDRKLLKKVKLVALELDVTGVVYE